jgi:hypothetical protein
MNPFIRGVFYLLKKSVEIGGNSVFSTTLNAEGGGNFGRGLFLRLFPHHF